MKNNNRLISQEPLTITRSPSPDLTVTDVVAPPAVQSGQRIDVSWTVRNQGSGDASKPWSDSIVLREVGNPDAPVIPLGIFSYEIGLQAGKTYTRSELLLVPANIQGQYTVEVLTNAGDDLYEGDANTNNLGLSDPPLQISFPPRPDLQIKEIIAPPEVPAGGTLSVALEVINQGLVATNIPAWNDRVFLSVDNQLSSDDFLLGSFENSAALGPSETYLTTAEAFVVPKFFRNEVYLIAETDYLNQVNEFPNDANNLRVEPIQITPLATSDLVTRDVVAPDQAVDGSTIEVRYTVTNLGLGETDRDNWTDTIWLTLDRDRPSARDRNGDPLDYLLGSFTHDGSLDVGESYEQIVEVTLPDQVSGELFITPWSDAYEVVIEETRSVNINPDDSNEVDNNNYKARPITVLLTPPADLVVTAVEPQPIGQAGDLYSFEWTVQNQGNGRTLGEGWVDAVYLSDRPTLDGGKRILLGRYERTTPLEPGEEYTIQETLQLTPSAEGMYIIVETGLEIPGEEVVWEGPFDNNNSAFASTQVSNVPADLKVTDITPLTELVSGEKATLSWTVENTGGATWDGTGYWTDSVFISTNPNLSSERLPLGFSVDELFAYAPGRVGSLGSFIYSPEGSLEAGGSYTQTQEITLPEGIGEDYYFYVVPNWDFKNPDEFRNPVSLDFYASHVFEPLDNNVGIQQVEILYKEADLQITELVVPDESSPSGSIIPVSFTVQNLGARTTRDSEWKDRVFISQDQTLDASDQMVGEWTHIGELAPQESYQVTLDTPIPFGIEGEYYILVVTDANIEGPLPQAAPEVDFELNPLQYPVFARHARTPEYRDEGNNLEAKKLQISPAIPPDLQVTDLNIPERIIVGQTLDFSYTVTNLGPGDTPSDQVWEDWIYLSRDEFLDLESDRYLDQVVRPEPLASGESYTVQHSIEMPSAYQGPFYLFVITDPPQKRTQGNIFEADAESNNATPSDQPLLLELPPPADLQVDSIIVPGSGRTGESVPIEWTVINEGDNPATGQWSDTVYLSSDAIWDIGDLSLGRATYNGTLEAGEAYTLNLDATLPSATPGEYRIIVRPDIFNQVYEAENEANNRTASADLLTLQADELELGITRDTTLQTGQERLYQVDVEANQTLKVTVNTEDSEAANELFIRFNEAPTSLVYDAAYEGFLEADQTAFIPGTEAGTYYILVRGHSTPDDNTPISLLAEVLPFGVTDIETDRGGDSRFVSTTITGAQFHPDALVKLVRPGFAEYEPVNYEVLTNREIRAIFDLTNAPHGLYDIKVINPDGQEAVLPYRYLVEQAIEREVDIGIGGPRVLNPGDRGTYGISVNNLANVDAPYVHFQYGFPELGNNELLFNFPYITYSQNLRGAPDSPALENVPWASLVSDINTDGNNLAPGYVLDLPTGDFTGQTINFEVYPGFKELVRRDFEAFREKLYFNDPSWIGRIETPQDLDLFYPELSKVFTASGINILEPGGLEELEQVANNAQNGDVIRITKVDPLYPIESAGEIAFQFYLAAAATALTRQEFIERQTQEALQLREAVLTDDTALPGLKVLAADEATWVTGYLAALEEVGLLRPEDEAPPVRENPLVLSLMAVLASGVLAGAAGEQILTRGDLVGFFEQIRTWYGHDSNLLNSNVDERPIIVEPPTTEDYEFGASQPTRFEAFNIYVPYGDDTRGRQFLDLPPAASVPPPDFSEFLSAPGSLTDRASLIGPFGFGNEQFVPINESLPYTIQFENPSSASEAVNEVRIVSELDRDLNPRQFMLGSLQIGDIQVFIPEGRGAFQGDFDFVESKGFVLRVNAGFDLLSNTATWLLQAIDPDTGELLQNPEVGLLLPNDSNGLGKGSVTYLSKPNQNLNTGAEITAQARVFFNSQAPADTEVLSHRVDIAGPTTDLTVERLGSNGTDYLVQWSAQDEPGGSGVKAVTVYVAQDGGDFQIWQRQTTDTSTVFEGEAGHDYEFLAIAVDNAGNRTQAPVGVSVPDDGSSVTLGDLPVITETTTPDLGEPPVPTTETSPNSLFTEAEARIPASVNTNRPAEFQEILRPFTIHRYVSGIPTSHGEIGPMALAPETDGSVLVSGGAGRNQLFRISPTGEQDPIPLATLSHPIFDLAYDSEGSLWAATGGGPLLKLNPETGEILQSYGDSITQSIAIHPETGLIYLSSGQGIEQFDPNTESFTHYSDLRVGSLTFNNTGELWAAVWPERGQLVRFDEKDKPQLMLELGAGTDSLAFGKEDTALEGLLFVSDNEGQLIAVDTATQRQVLLASGGSRGDIVETTLDGRILVSQSEQVDVISPLLPPQVAATNPPDDAVIALPQGNISVTFDQDMFIGDGNETFSVLNPINFQLVDATGETFTPIEVQYESDSRTARLIFDGLSPNAYELEVSSTLQSLEGLSLESDYLTQFQAVSDFSGLVDFSFSTARSNRANATISYDVTLTSTSDYDLQIPLYLLLDPNGNFTGKPQGATQDLFGTFLVDLSETVDDGILSPGESVTGQTLTIDNPEYQRVDFTPGIYTSPTLNRAPSFITIPLTQATADQAYEYQVEAIDPDGEAVTYLLQQGPDGMTLDPDTGVLSWLPTRDSPAVVTVTLQVFDTRGGQRTQTFTLDVEGGNQAPEVIPIPTTINGAEGELLEIPVIAFDPENYFLRVGVEQLPPGAVYDSQQQVLRWTPDYESAGTYENVEFLISDGVNQVSQSTTILIAPTDQSPSLTVPSEFTLQEGETVRLRLVGTDADSESLTYSSRLLPGGATLDRNTGEFVWSPTYFQAGEFEVPFTVSDGSTDTTETVRFTVLNANGVPEFDDLGRWQIQEGQSLSFLAAATDPDNPGFVLPIRLADGSLITPEDTSPATLSYSVEDLPSGASFDAETTQFQWTPDFSSAGNYEVIFRVTDDGDGTGIAATSDVTVPVEVLNTNRPPEFTPISNQTIRRGDELIVQIEAPDPDDEPVVITATGLPGFGIPDFATFEDFGNGTANLTFTPGFNDRGDFPITLTATDNGPTGTAEYSFILSVNAENEPPQIAYQGDVVAIVGEPMQVLIQVSDLDEDDLFFSFEGLPDDASLIPSAIYGEALLSWTPSTADLGQYAVTVGVTDSGNGNPDAILRDERTFNIVVRESNTAPVLEPIPNLTLQEGELLEYGLQGSDADGDALTYRAENLPAGASLDPVTGQLSWQTSLLSAGRYSDVFLSVTDGYQTADQTIQIRVNNTNQAPTLTPLPIQSGREGTGLQFTIRGNDADGDRLTYFPISSLPRGMRFNLETQQIIWTPEFDQAGEYQLQFGVQDTAGGQASLVVPVQIDDVNQAPRISVTDHQGVVGSALEFQVEGSDADLEDTLTFSALDLPEGATFDSSTGSFSWTPNPGQVGDYPVIFTVSDGVDSVQEAVIIRSLLTPPKIPVSLEFTPSFPPVPGQPVVINTLASSLANIEQIDLRVDGELIDLDRRNRGRFTPDESGQFLIEAIVTDADGFTGQSSAVLKVRDPLDTLAPVVNIAADFGTVPIQSALDLTGLVEDSNLDEWRLEIAPLGSQAFITLDQGSEPLDGVITQFKPGRLSDGFYTLRLLATDLSGRRSVTERLVEINQGEKLPQYAFRTTDLWVDLGGTIVGLERAYDSLNARTPSSFGQGWRFTNQEVLLQTDVLSTGREANGGYNPFEVGTRLYMTLPNGQRAGFTFVPRMHEIAGVSYYTPEWVADEGVEYGLESVAANLTRGGDRFYDMRRGVPYHPGSAQFVGDDYTLTGLDGTVYRLDAMTGIREQITPEGVSLIYTDSGITSSTGDAIQFERDRQGRITRVTASDGQVVTYGYDEQGQLLDVRQPVIGNSSRYAYDESQRLSVIANGNEAGSKIIYGDSPQELPIVADLGTAYRFNGQVQQGSLDAGATDRYTFSLRESEVNSTATETVLLAVELRAALGSEFKPSVPMLAGYTPIASRVEADRGVALFAIPQAKLHLLEVSAADGTAGEYEIALRIAGDINADGLVDGVDSQALALALEEGDTAGDLNLDGLVDGADVQVLSSNFGFRVNRPPIANPLSALTHEDLEVIIPFGGSASDPDGDEIFYSVLNPVNGTVQFNAAAEVARFIPTIGYTGEASFELLVDDGFNEAASVQVTVDVSDAPLLNLDFVERNPQLQIGDQDQLFVIGDFADQTDVLLSPNYLTFSSTDPNAASISEAGEILGISDGLGAFVASRNNIQAATAFSVGVPEDIEQRIIFVSGLDPYPDAIVFPDGNSERQIQVATIGHEYGDESALSSAEAGTQYFVGNPDVVDVSPDGRVTALTDDGETTITVINSGVESVIPVKVEAPVVGPVEVGTEGGVVQGEDGSLVMVGEGALAQPVTVSIAPVSEMELPIDIPVGFDFAGGFELDFENQILSQPVQLAIPLSSDLPEGTEVYFYRAGSLPDETGTWNPIWFQEEIGVVGTDGFVRTQSRPYPGINNGTYFMGTYPAGTLRRVGAFQVLSVPSPESLGLTALVAPSLGIAGLGLVGATVSPLNTFTLDLPIGFIPLNITSIPPVGLPTVTFTGIEVKPNTSNRIEINTPIAPAGSLESISPVINSLQLEITEFGPELVIRGDRFVYKNPSLPNALSSLGSQIGDLRIKFIGADGQEKTALIPKATSSEKELRVEVPNHTVLGVSDILIERPGYILDTITQSIDNAFSIRKDWVKTTFSSNTTRFRGDEIYVFAAVGADDNIAVIDESSQELIARIPVASDGDFVVPRSVATTNDRTRAYATLRFSSEIAVIDAQGLQAIDIDPSTAKIDHIKIETPGAAPFWAEAHPAGDFLYVSDEKNPVVYVIDIDPSSPTYHQHIQNIDIDYAPQGLRGLTASTDGKWLYVATPGEKISNKSQTKGKIIVINIDKNKRLDKSGIWHQPITSIEAGFEPYSIGTTSNPDLLTFVNRKADATGFGVFKVDSTSDDFSASTPRYTSLNLGNDDTTWYFDVNNAVGLAYLPKSTFKNQKYDYVFVSGFNEFITGLPSHDPNLDPFRPAGGNVGIIQDPFGPNAKLIAATRPIPAAFPDNLALSPDGRRLFAAYRGLADGIFVFNVEKIIKDLEVVGPQENLERVPINDIPRSKSSSEIDLKADYRLLYPDGSPIPSTLPRLGEWDPVKGNFNPTFGVPASSNNAPIGVGNNPQGLDIQRNPDLVSPATVTLAIKDNQNPNGTTTINNLQNHLFIDDSGEVEILIAHSERDISKQSKQLVDITIDGNIDSFLLESKKPFTSRLINLNPGDSPISLVLNIKDFLHQINTIDKDRLYGAKVRIQIYNQNVSSADSIAYDQSMYLYRFIDAADSNHTDGVVEMIDTLNDGSGNIIRERDLDFRVGSLATPIFEIADTSNFNISSSKDKFIFDPVDTQQDITSEVKILTPNGYTNHHLQLKGDGEKFEFYLDRVALLNTLNDLAAGEISGARGASFVEEIDSSLKDFLGMAAVSEASLLQSRNKARIVQNIVDKVDNLLSTFNPGLQRIGSKNATSLNIEIFNSYLDYNEAGDIVPKDVDIIREIWGFVNNPIDTVRNALFRYPPYGSTSTSNVIPTFTKVSQLLKNKSSYSQAEQIFRLSEAMNEEFGDTIVINLDSFFAQESFENHGLSAFENAVAKTIVHELGHAIGLDHTFVQETQQGINLPGARTDILAQGLDLNGGYNFNITGSAYRIALGLNWTIKDVQNTFKYFEEYLKVFGIPTSNHHPDLGLNTFIDLQQTAVDNTTSIDFIPISEAPTSEIASIDNNVINGSNTSLHDYQSTSLVLSAGLSSILPLIGQFTKIETDDPNSRWQSSGHVLFADTKAILSEHPTLNSSLFQTFTIPEKATTLQFTLFTTDLNSNLQSPADAFEVALLDALTQQSLLTTAEGLTQTEAILNLQANGQTYFSPNITLPITTSGDTLDLTNGITVTVDISNIPANTEATLYFDLLGFGEQDSSITIDNVLLLSNGAIPPTAKPDTANTTQNTPITLNPLTNDTDLDGTLDPSTLTLTTNPTNGTATLNPNGTLTYTPNPNFIGTDTLTYTIQDNDQQTSNPATVTITVTDPTPTITDLTGDTLLDEGQPTSFSATATDPQNADLTYTWDFGDNTPTATGPNPDHTYTDNGTYLVTLTVSNPEGLTAQQTLTVEVNNVAPTVEAGAVRTIDEGSSLDLNGSFTDPGTQDTHTIRWNFGDSNSTTDDLTPTHTYLDDGTYTATLTVTDNDGGTNADSITVTVNNVAPTITSLNGNTTLFEDVLTAFSATATDPGNDTLAYTWNFGDGTPEVTGENVEHQFQEPGQYTVTLTVDDGDGGTTQQTLDVNVQPLLPPTIDAIEIPTALDEGTSTSFSVTAQDPANLDLTYGWNFGDGSDPVSETMPTHRYADNGDYEVTVRVTNAAGRFTEQTQTVTVDNVAPTVNPGPDQTVSEGETVQFNGSFNDPGVLDTHMVQWDFGDGTQSTSLTPTHIYQQDGIYQATLTVTDNNGGVSSETLTVTVENVAPVIADTSGPITINEGESANFSVTASDAGDDTLNYTWNFGDGSPEFSGRTLSHQFNQDGTYSVTVTVTDSDGASTSSTFDVTVNNLAPTIQEATGQSPIQEGDIASFAATATDPGNDALTYAWDFGDGSPEVSEQNPSHLYQDNGTYTATVTVTDSDGASSQQSATIEVNNLPPTVEAGEDQTINEGQLVQFNGTFTDPGVLDTHTIEWTFGDGNNTFGDVTPTHTYLDDGVYTATLSVTDNDGGVGSDDIIVTVNNVAPTLDELEAPSELNEGDSAQFSVVASDPGQDTLSYTWEFGDGTNAVQGRVVNHTFTDNGTYTVTVTVTDDDGGVTQQTHTITVNNLAPIVDAGPDQIIYLGDPIQFTGTYQDPGTDDTHVLRWNFGDGSTESDTLTTTYTYQTEGIYAVSLTVLDDDQEFETDTLSVQVKPLPLLSVTDVAVQEGDNTDVDLLFTISLSEAGIRPVRVEFHTEDDTAIAGQDYEATSGQLTFQPGETSKTVRVKVLDDDLVESPEQFQLLLSNPIDARLETSSAVGTIEDNDESVPRIPLSINPIEGVTSSIEGESLDWSVSANDPNNQPLTYLWDFGDGSTPIEGQSVQHEFADDGTYTITVTVTNADGETAQTQSSITVANAAPEVNLDPVDEIDEGQTVSFAGSFTDSGSLDTHSILWDFGDGSQAQQGLTPTHTYNAPGQYTVQLTVTDNQGDTDTASQIFSVINVAPTIDALLGESPLSTLQAGNFSVEASDPGDTELKAYWNFGDGSPIIEGPQVQHQFENSGYYFVTVTVPDDEGASTQQSLLVQVEGPVNPQDSIIYGSQLVKLGKRTQIQGGDIFVDSPNGRLRIKKGATTGADVDIAANAIKLSKRVQISGDASFNALKNKGLIAGAQVDTLETPLFDNPYPFRYSEPGTEDILIGKGETLLLQPGQYDDVRIKRGGTLILDGAGVYHFDSIRGKKYSSLLFDANDTVEVRIQDYLKLKGRSMVGPAQGATIDASDIIVFIEGQEKPKRAAWFGKDSRIDANLQLLNGKLRLGRRTQVTGAFFAPIVRAKKEVTFQYDSYYDQPQTLLDKPQLFASLSHDNGEDFKDLITNDAAIQGQVISFSPISEFKVSLEPDISNSGADILHFLQNNRDFQLSQLQLEQSLGITFETGDHMLYFSARDEAGNETDFKLSFSFKISKIDNNTDISIKKDSNHEQKTSFFGRMKTMLEKLKRGQ